MAIDFLAQYEATRLDPPIRVRAAARLWLLALLGCPFLLLGSVAAMQSGEARYVAIGLVGVVFFGAGTMVLWKAIWLSTRRGVVELSEAGLFLAHIDLRLAWPDIGPAWIRTIKHRGGGTTETLFLLRNSDNYRAQSGWWARLMFSLLRSLGRSRKGSAWDWGLAGLMRLAKADKDTSRQLGDALEQIRAAMRDEPDTVLLNIPAAFCGRAACEELTAILNAELLRRTAVPGPAPHAAAPVPGQPVLAALRSVPSWP